MFDTRYSGRTRYPPSPAPTTTPLICPPPLIIAGYLYKDFQDEEHFESTLRFATDLEAVRWYRRDPNRPTALFVAADEHQAVRNHVKTLLAEKEDHVAK